MAALPNTRLTLADLAKYMDPAGKVQPVTELLLQRNDILFDPMWMPGNLPTGHQFSVRTALPAASLRDYNEGVLPSKSAVAQQTEGMSIIEAWSEVDAAEANLNGNAAEFRAGEDAAFIQTLEQTLTQLMIYGNTKTSSKEFNGIATRIAALANPQFVTANTGFTGGGAVYTSIYLAEWGDELFMTYPRGTEAGLHNTDLGRQIIQFTDGKRMLALVSQYVWNCGMVARDYRRLVRVGNIKVADVRTRTNSQALTADTNIIYKMTDALYRLPHGNGRRVFYMNRTCHAALAKIALDKSQNVVTIEQGLTQFGMPHSWLSFLGNPIRPVDKILNTEAEVV
jgi:hypothetical protein